MDILANATLRPDFSGRRGHEGNPLSTESSRSFEQSYQEAHRSSFIEDVPLLNDFHHVRNVGGIQRRSLLDAVAGLRLGAGRRT